MTDDLVLGSADDGLGDYTLFSKGEAAAALKLHPDTVGDLIREGELGHVRIGKRVLVRRDQLIEFIDQHTTTAAP